MKFYPTREIIVSTVKKKCRRKTGDEKTEKRPDTPYDRQSYMNRSIKLRQRVERELDSLTARVPETHHEWKDDGWLSLVVNTPYGRRVHIAVSPDYPFRSPFLTINTLPFHTLWTMFPSSSPITKNKESSCLCVCCRLITISSRWSPCRTLVSVVDNMLSIEHTWFVVLSSGVQRMYPHLPKDVCCHITSFLS